MRIRDVIVKQDCDVTSKRFTARWYKFAKGITVTNEMIARVNAIDFVSVVRDIVTDEPNGQQATMTVVVEELAEDFKPSTLEIEVVIPKEHGFGSVEEEIYEAITGEVFVVAPLMFTHKGGGTVLEFCNRLRLGTVNKTQGKLIIDSYDHEMGRGSKRYYSLEIDGIAWKLYPAGYGRNKHHVFLTK